jgi:hypothetical protein
MRSQLVQRLLERHEAARLPVIASVEKKGWVRNRSSLAGAPPRWRGRRSDSSSSPEHRDDVRSSSYSASVRRTSRATS